MNIYQKVTGEYYYSEHKQDKDDIVFTKNIGVEYAYKFCSEKNFGVKSKDVSKKNNSKPGHGPNEKWSAENRAMSLQRLLT